MELLKEENVHVLIFEYDLNEASYKHKEEMLEQGYMVVTEGRINKAGKDRAFKKYVKREIMLDAIPLKEKRFYDDTK